MLSLTIAQKQNILYWAYCVMTSIGIFLLYHQTQPQWVLFRKAERQYMQKDYHQAITSYQRSLSEGASTINAQLHLADSYVAVGEFSKAIIYYRDYLAVYPQAKEVHYTLAKALFWNGDLEESEKEYKKIMETK